jgi:uncharacterized protein YrrD
MAQVNIRIGDPVYSSDDKKLGLVDRVVLNDKRRRVEAIIVHRLLQAGDKIIELPLIDRVEEKRIVLRVDAGSVRELPAFFREAYIEVEPDNAHRTLWMSLMPSASGAILALAPSAGRRSVREVFSSGFTQAIPPSANVEVISNLPDEDVIISSRTDVLDLYGQKVGTVAEVMVDPQSGNAGGFVVRQGLLFKSDRFIPIEWVGDIGEKHLRLLVSAEQVEVEDRQWADLLAKGTAFARGH